MRKGRIKLNTHKNWLKQNLMIYRGLKNTRLGLMRVANWVHTLSWDRLEVKAALGGISCK